MHTSHVQVWIQILSYILLNVGSLKCDEYELCGVYIPHSNTITYSITDDIHVTELCFQNLALMITVKSTHGQTIILTCIHDIVLYH